MLSKTKITLIAAVVLGSASAVLAQSGEEMQGSTYQLNPNALVPLYARSVQSVPQPRALVEGRNVGIRFAPSARPIRDRFQGFGGY